MAPKEKYPFPIWPVIGLLLTVVLPIVLFPVGLIIEKREDQKEAREQARLKSARAKAMELCEAWSEKQPLYVNKPGLYRYSQTDFDDKMIGGTSIWIPNPDEFPKQEPSARCVIKYSEREHGVAEGILVPAKYRSKDWPCHRGKRLNPDHDPDNFFSKKYIECMPYEYQFSPFGGLGGLLRERSEPTKVWTFDLEGNLLPEE